MGGGVLLVPALLLAGVPIVDAVAISLFVQTVPQTLPALLMSAPKPFPWMQSVTVAGASMFGGIAGAWLIKYFSVPESTLKRLIAIILVVLGVIVWHIQ